MRALFQFNKGFRFAAAAAAVIAASLAFAGPVDRGGSLVNINAGVLVVDSNLKTPTLPDNPTPYAFLVLDRSLLAKPAGWNFVNPYSAGTVSAAAEARWNALQSIYGGVTSPVAGSLLNKQDGAYWEVSLDNMTSAQINQYRILLLPAYDALSLNPKERGLLRSFVDQGGILWVDTAPGMFADAGNGVSGASFVSNSFPSTPNMPLIYDQQNPLLTYPYQIQGGYATYDPTSQYNAIGPVDLAGAGFGSLIPILNTVAPDFYQFTTVVADTSGRTLVAYQRQGAGVVLVTTTRAAYAMGGQINGVGAVSPGAYTASAPNAQLIINAIYLADQYDQSAGSSRKIHSVPTDNGAPLIRAFKDEQTGGSVDGQTPVEYKGLLFVSKGNQLYAYSARPGSDLDSNGFKDDGLQDWSLGKGYDLVWVSPTLNGPISAPVAFSEPSLAGVAKDEVCVIDSQGNLISFAAFPVDGSGFFPTSGTNAPLFTEAPPTGNSTLTGPSPLAPTFANGLIFVADNFNGGSGTVGRIWVVDPRRALSGGNAYVNDWCLGNASQSVLNQTITAPCTVGYIPIADGSGGQDEVVYTPLGSGGSTGPVCGLASIWAGVVGEKHGLQYDGSGDLIIQTRAGASNVPIYVPGGYDANGIRVTLYDGNGNALTIAQMNNYLTGAVTDSSGTLVLPLKGGVSAATLQAAGITGVAVDYSIDWNDADPDVKNVVRGIAALPDDSTHSKNIIGSIALAPNGTLFLTEGNPASSDSNGTFFGIQEVGRGQFTVTTRWDLYPAYTIQNLQGGAADVDEPATLEDQDPIQSFAPKFLGGEFTRLSFVSAPSVSGNSVFVKARGFKKSFVPCTILLSFSASPPAPHFTIPNIGGGIQILQPDISRSSPANKTTPDVFDNAIGREYTSSQGANGTTLTFTTLSVSPTQLNQVMSQSMPVIVRQRGVPDLVLDPSVDGNWNTLQWYTILHGVDDGPNPQNADPNALTGAPVVTGSTVFVAGNSIIPAIFSGGSPFTAKPSGLLFGMTTNVSATDPYIVFNTNRRPYFHELNSLQVTGPGVISVNPDFKWPQVTGVTSFTLYIQRLVQTALGGADTANPRQCYGITAGNSGLYAYANTGVYGYRPADITVVDANRILTADSSGNAKWSSDQSDNLQGTAATSQNLSRVKTAHQISQTRWVYADPSTNSIGVIDRTGHAQSIKSFLISPYFNGAGNMPPGYQAGEELNLRSPGDVVTYSGYASPDPFNSATPISYLQHFLVADTGNHRIVDLVYDYPVDPTTHQIQFYTPTQPPFLFAQSDATFSGKNFAYSSIDLYQKSATDQVIVASVPDGVQSASSLGFSPTTPDPVNGTASQIHASTSGNGAVLLIDGANTQVINAMTVPAIPAGVIPDHVNGGFKAAEAAQTIPLGKVSSVSVSPVYDNVSGITKLTIMITNQDGVYELTEDTVSGNWLVDWMLPTGVFTDMLRDGLGNILPENPVDFRPVYARRTESGSVLIVNGYVGTDQAGNPYGGAVLEVDGSFAASPGLTGFNFGSPFLGFNSVSVQYQLPPIENGRSIEGPVFADRRF